jgi:hypothetical protein
VGSPAGNSSSTGASGGTPGAVATGQIVAGHEDASDLVPPDPGEGDVPPPEETTPATGTLTPGAASDLVSQTIGPSGGTIQAGGLSLEFPVDTFPADTPVTVTQAPVTAAGFGGRFTPLTPLYTVSAGDGTLGAPVIVTLPAAVPDGATALAFYYDETAGSLTPLAPIDANATSITAAANHFSGIVGGTYTPAAAPSAVDSGFRPGIDDWQFANHGSYVVPKGHCEGMSDTAIWYHVVQREKGGASPLNGLYDNNGAPDRTPTLQWDDSDGYRLASNVQADPTADPIRYWSSVRRLYGRADDRMTWAAFRAAIEFTGEPQEIVIGKEGAEHAMIVYRVTADRLFIGDPNYPARLRTITYDAATGKLAPYSSGVNAAAIAANGPKIYTKFAYVPWRSAATEARIAAHWTEFQNGTAGDAVFPTYALEALAGTDEAGAETWVPLVDGYASPDKQLRIRVRDPSSANDVAIKVFPGTSATPLGGFAAEQTISLQDGDTPLGIQVDFSKPADTQWRYVDFVRLTVRQQAASPAPAAGGSHWELVSSGRGQEFAATGSITDGQLADPDVNGYGGTGAWPAPPSILTPGQPVATALAASISPTCDAAGAEAVGLDGETAVSHKMFLSAAWAFPYGPETEIGAVATDCLNAEVSQTFDWAAPEPTGDTTHLGVRIRGGVDMGDRHAYEYVYEWRP